MILSHTKEKYVSEGEYRKWAILHPQIASLIRSGQNLYGVLQRIMPEINQELDNVAAVSNALLDQIPQALTGVPPQLRAQVTELADATKQLTAIMQSITPRLRWAMFVTTHRFHFDAGPTVI